MTRVVLDTNTSVSGLGWGGPPGNVDAIATGDADVLDLHVVEGIRILTPADFTDEL